MCEIVLMAGDDGRRWCLTLVANEKDKRGKHNGTRSQTRSHCVFTMRKVEIYQWLGLMVEVGGGQGGWLTVEVVGGRG